jgi:hypothetical protein
MLGVLVSITINCGLKEVDISNTSFKESPSAGASISFTLKPASSSTPVAYANHIG